MDIPFRKRQSAPPITHPNLNSAPVAPSGPKHGLFGTLCFSFVLTFAAFFVVASITAYFFDSSTLWLPAHNFKETSDWYEVTRTSVTVLAALGLGAGLVMAFRRQSVSERNENFEREREHYRRGSELYDSAIDQLGHESPAVRVAAMHTLDRLGQDHPGFRQPIVDVWCAYLRMPFDVESDLRLDIAEGQVRSTTQQLLFRRFSGVPGESWSADELNPTKLDVNLAKAELVDFEAVALIFSGYADFSHASFAGVTSFEIAEFHNFATFLQASFQQRADFSSATFHDTGDFRDSRFTEARFSDTQFCGRALFHDARFSMPTSFELAQFTLPAAFDRCTFESDVSFDCASFSATVGFRHCRFLGAASFDESRMSVKPALEDAEFALGSPDFSALVAKSK